MGNQENRTQDPNQGMRKPQQENQPAQNQQGAQKAKAAKNRDNMDQKSGQQNPRPDQNAGSRH